MIFRAFGAISTVRLHNSMIILPGNKENIPISEKSTIGDIYKALEKYKKVKVESLEGYSIGKSTFFYELQGASFILTVDDFVYKVIQSDLENSIEKYSFLLDSHEIHAKKRHVMHKYISKLEKIIHSSSKLTKEKLSATIHELIPKKAHPEQLTDQELSEKIKNYHSELCAIKPKFEAVSKKARFFTLLNLWSGFGVTLAQFLYIGSGTYYYYSWDVMEAQAYLIGLGNFIVGLAFFSSYKMNFSQLSVYEAIYNRKLRQYARKSGLDLERYEHLLKELKNLQSKITLD